MLSVSNRFSAPMRASNLSKGKVENKSQSFNFSGGKEIGIRKAFKVGGFTAAIVAFLGIVPGIFSREITDNILKGKVEKIFPAPKSLMINHNADLIGKNESVLFTPNSHKYLRDVIDSTQGKNVTPFKKFGVAKLLQNEELQRQKDSAIAAFENQIKKLK